MFQAALAIHSVTRQFEDGGIQAFHEEFDISPSLANERSLPQRSNVSENAGLFVLGASVEASSLWAT